MGSSDRGENMPGQIADVNIQDKVHVHFPKEEELKLTTHCYCCMGSFYLDYPACCGSQYDQQCICCTEAVGVKCLQIEPDTKVWDAQLAQRKCLDYTSGDLIVEEGACQAISC